MSLVHVDSHQGAAAALHGRALLAAETLERLGAVLAVPAGHRWRFDRVRELTWNFGGPGMSVAGYVERYPGDPADAEQLHCEVRIHLDVPDPAATVFAAQGERYLGQSRVLPGTPAFLQAPTFDALYDELTRALDGALAPFVPPTAPAAPEF